MRRNSTGLMTLLGIGGYYLYRNRDQVSRFMGDRNINFNRIPLLNRFFSNSSDTVGSHVDNVSSNVDNIDDIGVTNTDSDLKRAV